MISFRNHSFQTIGLILVAVLLSACQGPVQQSSESGDSQITLLEKRFFEIRELELDLYEAMKAENADQREIQRLFQRVDLEYAGLLSRNPDNIEIKIMYGKLLSRVGDTKGAITQLGEVLMKDPDLAAVNLELSTCFAEEGDYTRAMFYAFRAQELEPETAAYHFQMGQILAAFRNLFIQDEIYSPAQIDDLMLDAFNIAKNLRPDELPLQFRYGEAFYDIDNPDWELALQHWLSLIQHPALTDTEADAVRLHQAKCLLELGRIDQIRALSNDIQTPAFRQSIDLLLSSQFPFQDN